MSRIKLEEDDNNVTARLVFAGDDDDDGTGKVLELHPTPDNLPYALELIAELRARVNELEYVIGSISSDLVYAKRELSTMSEINAKYGRLRELYSNDGHAFTKALNNVETKLGAAEDTVNRFTAGASNGGTVTGRGTTELFDWFWMEFYRLWEDGHKGVVKRSVDRIEAAIVESGKKYPFTDDTTPTRPSIAKAMRKIAKRTGPKPAE